MIMLLARIENNTIVETRDISIDDVPPHKRQSWRQIVGDPPNYDPRLQDRTGPVYLIEADRVVMEWTVVNRSLPDQSASVKAEAQRRIVALTGTSDITACMIKQNNANMRANELNDIRHVRPLTDQETIEANALRTLSERIKAIRTASNVIEAMTPIPSDFADDRWWPQPAMVANPEQRTVDRIEQSLLEMERRLAVGLQMTDAMFDIIGGVTPTAARYPNLASVLGLSDGATLAEWQNAINLLRSDI